MASKQLKKSRQAEQRKRNRENYLKKRRHWCFTGGPLVVEDRPDYGHAKSLLLEWAVPRKEIAKELNAAGDLSVQLKPGLSIISHMLRTSGVSMKDMHPDFCRMLDLLGAGR